MTKSHTKAKLYHHITIILHYYKYIVNTGYCITPNMSFISFTDTNITGYLNNNIDTAE